MRRARSAVLAMVGFVFALAVAFASASPASADGTLSGQVTDSSATGLDGIAVNVTDPIWGVVLATTTTSGGGNYSLPVAAGSYRMYFRDPANVLADRFSGGPTGTSSWAASAVLSVTDGGGTVQNAVMYPKTATFSGTVTHAAAPAPGVTVQVRNLLNSVVASDVTDGSGQFDISATAPGTYLLTYTDPTNTLATEYFPGTPSDAGATTFAVYPGDTVNGSIDLPLAGVLEATSTVGGTGMPNMVAVIISAVSYDTVGYAITDVHGVAQMPNLPPGPYKVAFVDPNFFFGPSPTSVRPVVAPDHDVLTEGLFASLLNGQTYVITGGAATDVGDIAVTGLDCDPTVFTDGANLAGADLSGQYLVGCPITNTDLTGADLAGADLTGADLEGTNLTGANGINTVVGLLSADLRGVDFTATGLDLNGANLVLKDFTGTDFGDADLTNALVFLTNFSDSDLSGTTGFKTGVGTPFVSIDDANLSGQDLAGINLAGVSVGGVNLDGADLSNANFTGSPGIPAISSTATFSSTICPSGTPSNVRCPEWSITPTITVSAPDTPVGSDVLVTVQVTGSAGAGTTTGGPVHVEIDAQSCDIAALDLTGTGSCTISTLALPTGTRTVSADFAGDANYSPDSASSTFEALEGITTTAVVSDVNPSVFGETVTFTATVSTGVGTPTGTVDFYDGVTLIGSDTLDGGGQASVATGALAVGSHSITAEYLGDGTYAGSTSPAITQDVNQAATTVSVTSDIEPSNFGEAVTFTATVTPTAPGAGTPTGSVQFYDGLAPLGAPVVLPATDLVTDELSVGSHTITAVYSGDTNFTGSTSPDYTQGVDKAAVTIDADSPTITLGDPDPTIGYSQTGEVSGFPITPPTSCGFAGPITGAGSYTTSCTGPASDANYDYTYNDGTLTVDPSPATVTITADDATITLGDPDPTIGYSVTGEVPGFPVTAPTSCGFAGPITGAGPYTTSCSGPSSDANYDDIQYADGTLTVDKATVTLTETTSQYATIGSSKTVSATVTTGVPFTPTGSVTFTGPAPASQTCTAPIVAGAASCNIASFAGPAGTQGWTADYSGDANFEAASTNFDIDAGDAPVITSPGQANPPAPAPQVLWTNGVFKSVTFNTTGTAPITWGISGALPSGVTFNTATGVLEGTPSVAVLSAYSVNITASNPYGNFPTSGAWNYRFTVGFSPTITSSAPSNGTWNTPYSFNFTAAGTSPVTITMSGSVPGLSTSGGVGAPLVLSGTPTTVGSYPVTVTAHNNFAPDDVQNYNVVIDPAGTTTVLGSYTDPVTVGDTVPVSATVTSGVAGTITGTVDFAIGADTCSAPVAAGAAGCDIVVQSAGSSTLSATYGGDSNFAGSNDSGGITVDPAATTTVYTGPVSFTFSVPATVSATVTGPPSGPAITGNVLFTLGSSTCLTPVSGGAASCSLTPSAAGLGQTLTTQYQGDTNYDPSSDSDSVDVAAAATTTAVTSDVNPSVFGQNVTFTATVSPVPPAGGSPTGYVQFSIDGSPVGSPVPAAGQNLSFETGDLTGWTTGGPATQSVSGGGAPGQGLYAAQISTGVSQGTLFTPATLSQQFTANAGDTISGWSNFDCADYEPFTDFGFVDLSGPTVPTVNVFFAQVDSNCPGWVNWSYVVPAGGDGVWTLTAGAQNQTDDSYPSILYLDGVSVSGAGTLSTSALSVGDHTVTAEYLGDANFSGSTSPDYTQTVNEAGTETALASDVNPSVFGESVEFTATVSAVAPGAGTPTGTVDFVDDTTVIGDDIALVGGQATFSTSALSLGDHPITAVYNGDDPSFTGSTSPELTQAVGQTDTSTALTSDVSPSVFGQDVEFTATVSAVAPGSGTPTGTVDFVDGVTVIGDDIALVGGQATFSTSSLAVGGHTMTAVYNGDDPNFTGSTSPDYTQTVDEADTETAVSTSPNPSVYGQTVTITIDVTAALPGSGTPTGTVDFYDGPTLVLDDAPLTGGQFQATISSAAAGSYSLSAVYNGEDPNFAGSTSATHVHVVNEAATTTALTSDVNPSALGANVTFTATVSAVAPGAGTPTGTVDIYDGVTPIADDVALVGGQATWSTSSLSAGTHTMSAVYNGEDTNFTGSTSPDYDQDVSIAATSTTYTGPTTGSVGQSANLLATVSPAISVGVVTFDGPGANDCSSPITGGLASCTIPSLAGPDGTQSFTISYHDAGGNYADSSTNADIEVGTPPTIVGTPPTAVEVNTAYGPFTFTSTGTTPVTLALSGDAVPGLTSDSPNVGDLTLSGTPTVAGSYDLTVTATNAFAPTAIYNFTLVVGEAPVITSVVPDYAANGVPYSFFNTATGTVPLTWGFGLGSGIPPGLTINPSTGEISGTPSANGVYFGSVEVSNAYGSDSQNYLITVGIPPTITSGAPTSPVADGDSYSFTVTAIGNPDIDFAISSGFVPGLSIDNVTGELSGNPSPPGSYTFDVTASSPFGSDTETYTIVVTGADCATAQAGGPGLVLQYADVRFCDLSAKDFTGADFEGTDFRNANLTGVNFTNASLVGVDFCDADLTGADFSGADLTGANFDPATITGADFSGALNINDSLNLATTAVNGWFDVDFSSTGLDLSGVDLTGVDLSSANIDGVDLSGADLTDANFIGSTGVPIYDLTTVFLNTTCADGNAYGTSCPEWRTPQTVSFDTTAPVGALVGGGPYTPTASASGGTLTMTISVDPSTTNNACSISGGDVSFDNDGTCVLLAEADGDFTYAPASTTQSFAIAQPPAPGMTAGVTGKDEADRDMSVNLPVHQEGDLLLAAFASHADDSSDVVAPLGWTLADFSPTSGGSVALFTRTATASEPTPVTFTNTDLGTAPSVVLSVTVFAPGVLGGNVEIDQANVVATNSSESSYLYNPLPPLAPERETVRIGFVFGSDAAWDAPYPGFPTVPSYNAAGLGSLHFSLNADPTAVFSQDVSGTSIDSAVTFTLALKTVI